MPRAVVVHEEGPYQNAKVEETPPLEPSKGCAVVQVESAGVAFPDILTILGKHVMRRPVPFVPGGEVCGEVIAVGEGVSNLQVGDRVFGGAIVGGYSEQALVLAEGVYKLQDGVDADVAAGFELNYGTTYHGLVDLAGLQSGETLLVLGASGGVGAAAVDIGRAFGATVIACAGTPEKLEFCRTAGADFLINYEKDDLRGELKKIQMDGKIDVVYDPVGGRWAEPALRSLGWGGRFLVVGFASGGQVPKDAIPNLPANLALLNERKIIGVFWGPWKARDKNRGNRRNIDTMMGMVREGKLKPIISRVYALETASFHSACEDIMNRRVLGKVCLRPPASAKL